MIDRLSLQPLYQPSDHISLLFTKRLRHMRGELWQMTGDEAQDMQAVLAVIRNEGDRFLSRFQSPVDLATTAHLTHPSPERSLRRAGACVFVRPHR
jgi:hypothetical protein